MSSVGITTYLSDYQAPDFKIITTELNFNLQDEYTEVTAQLQIKRTNSSLAPLKLHGQQLNLISIALDGTPLSIGQYAVDDEFLTINELPDNFLLSTCVRIEPHKNTALEGLYRSRTMYCTQCEAEGFRKITYYLDRPDAMSSFATRIEADKTLYPVLLSNGNLIAQGELPQGRHFATWQDPFKKPAYLFALVAGDLSVVEDSFTTASGRDVALKIFVEAKDVDKCSHAMLSLKNAMRWDEQVYGREYDLDIFMIVAVDDFNMGAMENKGLNIFNTSCVLAHPATTTDAGFARVEGVVAHEYFHNWSGNRVTCRDWFQLSLKEGFTVFRDEEFSADMLSRTVKRVESVALLRTAQFAEDAGPMSHPVRPSSYMEISNFYTLTVYEKGAEVVRMVHSLLGKELFRQGTDLYFSRHDGEAATIEQFIACMAEVSGRDFSQFMHWYNQAGTPTVEFSGRYDAAEQRFYLTARQSCPSTPEATAEQKEPFVIPIDMGLLSPQGAYPLICTALKNSSPTRGVIELNQREQTFIFEQLPSAPVPSLLRGFSAPVKWHYPYSKEDLLCIMLIDEDGFNRWDAIQQYALRLINEINSSLNSGVRPKSDTAFINACAHLLSDVTLDPAMVALMLDLPSEAYLAEQQNPMDIDGNQRAREFLRHALAENLLPHWHAVYNRLQDNAPFSASAEAVARRSLKNLALVYISLVEAAPHTQLIAAQFNSATNMTDSLAVLKIAVNSVYKDVQEHADQMLETFYSRWQGEPLVVNLWLSVQAAAATKALNRVKSLMEHPAYDGKNPNKIRALVGVFSQNLTQFHALSGEGYEFLAQQVVQLDQLNPQIAARLIGPLTKWQRQDIARQAMMVAQLRWIAAHTLSNDLFEVVTKSLPQK
ncbi:MAG TPA: aminopeptidase N [Cellvibrionaceae bacterium]